MSDFIFSFDPEPPILLKFPANPPDLWPRIGLLFPFMLLKLLFLLFLFAVFLFAVMLHCASKNKKARRLEERRRILF